MMIQRQAFKVSYYLVTSKKKFIIIFDRMAYVLVDIDIILIDFTLYYS